MPLTLFTQRLQSDLVRYFLVSLLALATDTGTLSLCLRLFHLSLAWSATLGFVVGASTAYVLSIYWVFKARSFGNAPVFEFFAFTIIGLVGLGITQLVLWLGVTQLHFIAEATKLAAAIVTFAFNYIARKTLLFASSRRNRAAPGNLV